MTPEQRVRNLLAAMGGTVEEVMTTLAEYGIDNCSERDGRMNPRLIAAQAIHQAWVNHARLLMEAQTAQGLKARQPQIAPWLADVAITALVNAGWTPPKECGCEPAGAELEEAICGRPAALTEREWKTIDAFELALRDIADQGEWPEGLEA